MRRPVLFLAAALSALTAFACSSSSGTTTTTTGSGGSKTTSTTTTGTGGTTSMCVKPGSPGNSLGVGKYCTPGGNECTGLPAGLCTADIGQSDWFCVKVTCQTNTDCGADAQCVMQTGGSGCVPDSCLGGTDGGTTTGTGGSSGTGGSPGDAGTD